MTKTNYAALRLDPRWQRKRLEVMERDGFKCVDCDNTEKTLNVHHAYYVTGRMPWDYPMFSLSTLCKDCHKDRHEKNEDTVYPSWAEWESEMEWVLNDDPKNQGAFWYAAAALNDLVRSLGPEAAYKAVEEAFKEVPK